MKRMKQKNKAGFSLVEMMVAMAIAVIVMLTIVAAFGGIVKARNAIRNEQQDLENARNAMDFMAKELRMSTDVSSGTLNSQDDSIAFFDNYGQQCAMYTFFPNANGSGTIKTATVGPTGSPNVNDVNKLCQGSYANSFSYVKNNDGGNYSALTSGDNNSGGIILGNLKGLESLKFFIPSNLQNPTINMGRATILMVVDGQSLETTVSFRNYSNL